MQAREDALQQDIPEVVSGITGYLDRLGLYQGLSMNYEGQEAGTCLEACNVRFRNGERGSAPWSEMKSLVYEMRAEGGEGFELVMVHCRGDRMIDEEKLAKVLNREPDEVRMAKTKRLRKLGMDFGTVHPFNEEANKSLRHIVDPDLINEETYHPFGTVTTNAGNKAWSIRFNPKQFFENEEIDGVFADISKPNPDLPRPFWAMHAKRIGVLGGNSPGTMNVFTSLMRRYFRDHIYADLKKLGITDEAINMGDIAQLETDTRSRRYMAETMSYDETIDLVVPRILKDIGRFALDGEVDLVAIPCNTTPRTEVVDAIRDEIAELQSDVEFLPINEALVDHLTENGIDNILLLGVGETVKAHGAYIPLLDDKGIEYDLPEPEIGLRIDALARQVKSTEADGDRSQDASLAKELESIIEAASVNLKPGQKVVIACTELSEILFERSIPEEDFAIDSLAVYAKAIAKIAATGKR